MNSDIIQYIQDYVDDQIKDLSDADYVEVLDEIASNFQTQSNCKKEELERET